MRLVYVLTMVLSVSVAAVSGCNSCERVPEAPAPVAKDGRLPRVPDAEVTPQPSVIPPPACAVVAAASVEEGTAPLSVQFTAEGMCTDAAGVFTWSFGDGSAPTHEQNPTHVYSKPGSYTAHVTLADDEHSTSDADEAPLVVTSP